MNKSNYGKAEKLGTIDEARDRYHLCRKTLIKYAKEYGAFVRFGRLARIDFEIFDREMAKNKE